MERRNRRTPGVSKRMLDTYFSPISSFCLVVAEVVGGFCFAGFCTYTPILSTLAIATSFFLLSMDYLYISPEIVGRLIVRWLGPWTLGGMEEGEEELLGCQKLFGEDRERIRGREDAREMLYSAR